MARKTFIIIILAILSIFLIGCTNDTDSGQQAITFAKTFGGASSDMGFFVRQTADGGYILIGSTESFGAGSADIYLIKTDTKGNEEWSATFGTGESERGYCVRQTTDGGYILIGYTGSFADGDTDMYLIKTDAGGNELFSRTFGGDRIDLGYSLLQTTDGGYILLGETSSFSESSDSDIYLVKTDADGIMQWSKTFGGGEDDNVGSVQQTADGGYVIVGRTHSLDAGGSDVYLIKTDLSGDEQWSAVFGGTGFDYGNSVKQTTDGGYILSGGTDSFGSGGYDAYLIKTDEGGNELWSATFGGTDDEWGNSVTQTTDGGFMLFGWTESFGAGADDMYLIKTGGDGNKIRETTYGGTGSDWGASMQQTSDGGFILFGTTDSFGSGGDDMYLIKTDKNGNVD